MKTLHKQKMHNSSHDSPLVSVFMPVYNQEDFITEAIESVISQDYRPIELVIGDDCSNDNSWAIIQEYTTKYPRLIKSFRNDKNLGITDNCNKVLTYCTGKYIAFTAGDDLFLPGKLSAQIPWLEADSSRTLCGHQIRVIYDDGSPSHKFTPCLTSGQGAEWVIKHGCPYGGVSIVLRTSAIPITGYDKRLPSVSDQKLWIDSLGHDGKFGYVGGVLALYRKHHRNITGSVSHCQNDQEKMFEIIEREHPEYSSAVRIGRRNQLSMAKAKILFKQKRYFRAMFLALQLHILSPSRLCRAVIYKFWRVTGI